MPGWVTPVLGQARPFLLSISLMHCCCENDSLAVSKLVHACCELSLFLFTLSLTRNSSSLLSGGLGKTLFVRSGGLTLRGVLEPDE